VVDVDLEKFFDRVNHDVLMGRLAKRIDDRRLLWGHPPLPGSRNSG
jgi:RNA-directed DNA polymerase